MASQDRQCVEIILLNFWGLVRVLQTTLGCTDIVLCRNTAGRASLVHMRNASIRAYLEQREEQPWPLCAAFAAVLWQTRLHAAASARQDSVPCTGQRLACSTSPPAPLQCAYVEDKTM